MVIGVLRPMGLARGVEMPARAHGVRVPSRSPVVDVQTVLLPGVRAADLDAHQNPVALLPEVGLAARWPEPLRAAELVPARRPWPT